METPVRDGLVTVGETRLHYVVWGTGGTPIVCLHGVTANAFAFQALADALAPDHRIVAFDLRGRGDSDKPPSGYSIPIYAADLAGLIAALDLDRPVVLGHSLGALVALYFAAHYPDRLRKLVLIDGGAPIPWPSFDAQPAWLKASVARIGVPVASFVEYVSRLKAAPFLGPYWNAYLDRYYEHDVTTQPDGSVIAKTYRPALVEEADRLGEGPPEAQWAGVRVPTLLLQAGQGLLSDSDQVLSAEGAAQVQAHIADCRLVSFPTLNHYTIVLGTEPGPAAAIRAFIDGA